MSVAGATKGGPEDPRFIAAIEMLRRTGAVSIGIRFQDDEDPTVWLAVATWDKGEEAAGAMTPLLALMRLCGQVIDGGTCMHCGRTTVFSDDFRNLPLADAVCWYAWDPEAKTFRRGCE